MAVAGVSPTVASTPASLYVGDLHPEVTDSQLYDEFSEFKTLTSVRVCRDSTTGRSLCYGYVNFVAPSEAMRAIEVKNHSRLNGKAIRVMWSHRDPEARRSGAGNVFVKNLPESIDSGRLEEIFKPFGLVLSCKVAVYDDGKSKGYGFVQFHSDEAANSAIQKLNGFNIEEKEMFVGKFVKKSDRVMSNPNAKYTNLYVKNLDIEVTEDSLNEKFSEFGKTVSLAISKDENGTSRGFGFVNFEKPEDARRAMEVMNGSQLGSKILYVSRAQKKAERVEFLRRQFEERRRERMLKYQGSNVYVKNIDDAVTEEELCEHFSSCGTITSAKLMKDDKGISKGFGFVCFSTPEEAVTAVNTSHGLMFHKKPLYVAIAQRKDERQARLHLHYAQIAGYAGSPGMIPGGYQPVYYTAPLVSPIGQPPMIYQPMGMRPSWRPNGFGNPSRPHFQQSPVHMAPVVPRQRQNRPRVGGYTPQYGGNQFPSHASHPHRSSRSTSPKEANAHLRGKSSNNNRGRDLNRAAVVSAAAASSAPPVPPVPVHEGSEMLSSMLAAASPDNRKQILGERLFPLVSKRKPDLAAKVTGMLLEMDNAELLLLLESPESLAAKVDEAVEVLKVSKTKVPAEGLHSNFLPAAAGVAVN